MIPKIEWGQKNQHIYLLTNTVTFLPPIEESLSVKEGLEFSTFGWKCHSNSEVPGSEISIFQSISPPSVSYLDRYFCKGKRDYHMSVALRASFCYLP